MKKLYLFAALVLLASCSSSYQFVQVQEYSAGNGNSMTVENEDVRITYSVANLADGWCSYAVYNKTDGFVYIDKSKSFTVDPAGYAHNVITSEERCMMTAKKQTFMQTPAKDSVDYSVYTSSDIVVIPPKAMKTVYGLASGHGMILHCDLPQYPSKAVSVNVNEEMFTAVTTYRTDGKQQETTVSSVIKLDKVSNMPEYIIARYTARQPVCENMKEAGKIYPPDDEIIYDMYYDVKAGSMTFPYYVKNSTTKYFDYKPEYEWYESVDGYKKVR